MHGSLDGEGKACIRSFHFLSGPCELICLTRVGRVLEEWIEELGDYLVVGDVELSGVQDLEGIEELGFLSGCERC